MFTNRDKKILVVDDEENIRMLISEHLKSNGYNCSIAANGKEALEKLERDNFELVLSDIKMPVMDGIELIKKIMSEYKDIVVIMVTSVFDTSSAIEAMRIGAYDYITKPFYLDNLLLSVERALERRRLIKENREYQQNLELRVEEQTKEIRNTFLNAIEALAQALEAKDPYTNGHSKRVTDISIIIGKKKGLDNQNLDKLKLAGILHDIGKIGVTEEILNKPSKLTKEEYQCIITHPEIGAKILDYLIKDKEIIDIIKHHHEFYNGRGYPDRLKGNEIPLGARILTVADTFDAMTSTRPYRNALSFEYAYDELKRCKGTQFDPEIVDVILECRKEVEKVMTEEKESVLQAVNY